MAVDIVPQLQENIYKLLAEKRASNEQLAMLSAKLAEGKAKYTDAHAYAKELGEMLSQTLGESVNAEMLPDGTMYFNIADRVIRPLMVDDFNEIADYAVEVQRLQNELDGIGLKGVKPELNEDRIDGIINRVSSEPFDDVKWLLDDPIVNYSMAAVDDTVKANGEFLYKAGLDPVIVRTAEYKCCKWCSNLEGKYPYGTEPRDVYRRHERCRCETELSRNGKRENVWSKITYKDTHRAEILERINNIANADKNTNTIELPSDVKNTFLSFEQKYGKSKTEHGTVIYNEKQFDSTTKSRNHVTMPAAAKNSGASTIHNHPISSPPSHLDVLNQEMYANTYSRVVDMDGNRYTLYNPSLKQKKREECEFFLAYAEHIENEEKRLDEERISFRNSLTDYPKEERAQIYSDFINSRDGELYNSMNKWLQDNADKFGWKYQKEIIR